MDHAEWLVGPCVPGHIHRELAARGWNRPAVKDALKGDDTALANWHDDFFQQFARLENRAARPQEECLQGYHAFALSAGDYRLCA